METIKIEAQTRDLLTRGELNGLRKQGWIPAVVYGSEKKGKQDESALLKIHGKSFLKLIGNHKRSNAIVELAWGKDKANVIVKAIQRDAVSQDLLHIDFQKIIMTEKIEVKVAIHLAGEAPGVKLSGGILEHITRELKILCLPKDIPARIDVDVSKLEIGQGISVKDIPAVPGVEVLSDPNLLVANVVAPTVLEEVAAPVAGTTAEPEVIAKGKKPEEGEAAPAGAAPAKPAMDKAGAVPPKGAAPGGK